MVDVDGFKIDASDGGVKIDLVFDLIVGGSSSIYEQIHLHYISIIL